jgi:polygalacturonase
VESYRAARVGPFGAVGDGVQRACRSAKQAIDKTTNPPTDKVLELFMAAVLSK